jgi:ubiquinone/menaquinone biosynthesis C-methylase UbiE
MNVYERHVLPRLTHWLCGSPTIDRQRRAIVPRARGRVLEIGFGSGLNLPHYVRDRVDRVWALEPSPEMRALAAARIADSGLDVQLLDASAEAVPLPDASVDTVLVTFSLCTIPDPSAALREARRVLRPDGQLLFCEHGAAPDATVRRWQDRVNGVWKRCAGGCSLNRDVTQLLEAAGFAIAEARRAYLPGTPRVVGYVTWGSARPAPGPLPRRARARAPRPSRTTGRW